VEGVKACILQSPLVIRFDRVGSSITWYKGIQFIELVRHPHPVLVLLVCITAER
jgi:hypothetical protein